MGSAGENDGAWQQRGAAAEKGDDGRDIKDEVVATPVLHDLTIEDGADLESGGVGNLVLEDEAWTEGSKGVEGLATAPLASAPLDLPVAGADIVGAGVSKNVVQGLLASDIAAASADDDGEFAFIVDLVAAEVSGKENGVARVLHGSGGLHEEHGAFGNGDIALGGMAAVIEADAQDVGRGDGGEELVRRGDAARDGEVAVNIAINLEGRAIGLERGMADGAVNGLESDQFHFVGKRLRKETSDEEGRWLPFFT